MKNKNFIFICLLYQHLKTKNLKTKHFINYFKILQPYYQMPQTTCTYIFFSCQNLFNLEIPNLVGY